VQNEVFYDGVQVDSARLLGEPGGGLAVASDAMMVGRLGIGAACVGAMWRALQIAGRYSQRRRIGGTALIESDLTRARLGSMYAAVHTVDRFVDRLAADVDSGIPVPPEAYAAVKIVSSEWLWETVDQAIQLLGGRGYVETNCLPQMLRDARITRLFEGPTDTLQRYIGRRVLDPDAALFHYLSGHLQSPQLAAALQDCLEPLRQVAQLGDATAHAVHAVAGELAALHLARAFVAESSCAEWLDARIARTVGGALQTGQPNVGQVERWLESVAARIGDVEQGAPDEDRLLDSYLGRSPR